MRIVKQEGRITWVEFEEDELCPDDDPHMLTMTKVMLAAMMILLGIVAVLTT